MSARKYYTLDLSEEFRRDLRETLEDMIDPVEINVFIDDNCETCEDTVALIKAFEEEAPVRDGKKLITVKIYNRSNPSHQEEFKRQRVERVPTVTLIEGYIKYTGIPAEEEIRGFVETLLRISEGDSGLEDSTKAILANLRKEVYIETIVTPSCPYCPYAVLLANMFAYEAYKQGSKKVISDTVEAYENPDIADGYGVHSVPAIAINKILAFIGVPYEEDFIRYVKAASEGKLEELVLKEYGDATSF
ncbi:MAG: thioredoxin family protein [Desulfurococcales archaeon]|nr:thioredoxin family protein [Desulfurococcales archaeon]